ncbi:cell wall metabolism sensor histidine kinase WalK [Ammoniphilus sp. YIM 78166]|uniref:sensor histidine kinase n=1 Tax=Ammoniphilus sp. YIM 78166 TaxID=1644106 RepID=UPI001070247E|nr:HAMP domain-containing sensor histidine kinase [Ammoniphilus sp. YIM 78166]
MKDQKHLLFKEESSYLQEAKEKLKEAKLGHVELMDHFAELIDHYERLLKVSSKVFKISDIQSKALIDREIQLQHAHNDIQKIEDSRRKLISDISHEIGTPMTSIQGYLKAMIDEVIETDESYIRLIYHKVQLVNRLIEDLYDLSKIEYSQTKLKFQDIKILDLFELLFSKYQLDVHSRDRIFTFTCSLADDLLEEYVCIDPMRIEQVLTNLIQNAVKFTSVGGNIQLTVSSENQDLVIRVSDDGLGISDENLPFIFDRFFKTKGKTNQEGTGLGLSISREIVHKHRGEMGVKSTIGEGSTFFFTLPIQGRNQYA